MSQPQKKVTIKQAISQAKKAAKKGNAALALQLYQTVLQHQPNHPIAKKGVRKLKKEVPNSLFAEEQDQNPSQDQLDALFDLFHSGQLPKAELACRQLLQSYPNSLVVNNVLGVVLKGLGRLEEAVQAYDRVIQLKPDYAVAYSNRGVALQELGKLKEAIVSCGKSIQLNPGYAEAHRCLSSLKKYKSDDPHIELMEEMFVQSEPDEKDRLYLCYALAKDHDNLGEFDKSFNYLKEGRVCATRS